MLDSAAVAAALEAKFERDRAAHTVRLRTPEEAARHVPTRCLISEMFGPFFREEEEEQA